MSSVLCKCAFCLLQMIQTMILVANSFPWLWSVLVANSFPWLWPVLVTNSFPWLWPRKRICYQYHHLNHLKKTECIFCLGPRLENAFHAQLSWACFFSPKNLRFLATENCFFLNIAEHDNFSSNKLLFAFSYLLAERISCLAELSTKKCFITSGPDTLYWFTESWR